METAAPSTLPSPAVQADPLFESLDASGDPLPLVVRPAGPDQASTAWLERWVHAHAGYVRKKMVEHGAVLFRGFELHGPEDFQRIALQVDPGLQDHYLGTSPRENKTRYVFSASEIPGFFPIMQHCEMSFLPSAPKRLFFYCHVQPQVGGETPLTDFRKVVRDMDPAVRQAFEQKGVRTIRNYIGPDQSGGIDKWHTKNWADMFKTRDKAEVEAQAQREQLDASWLPGDRLRLENVQPAIKPHPETGEPVWFNHTQVFHVDAARLEYSHIRRRQRTPRAWLVSHFINALTWYKKRSKAPEEQATHCTYGDGSPIPPEVMRHVSDLIWRHMVFLKWKQGDMVAIDNYSTAHGRMPYSGPRDIQVAWTTP